MGFFSKKDKDDFFEIIDTTEESFSIEDRKAIQNFASHAITPDEINRQAKQKSESVISSNPLDALKNRMINANAPKKEEVTQETEKNDSLFDRCKPYVTDDDGNIVKDTTYDYSLDDFTDPKTSGSELLDMLYKKYNIKFDNPSDDKASDEKDKESDSPTIKSVQTNLPVISDIDDESTNLPQIDSLSQTGTIRFTPVTDEDGEKDIISVSSQTRAIDLTGELTQMPSAEEEIEEIQTKISENEFEEYIPKEEFVSPSQSRSLVIKLAKHKRNRFLGLVTTILLTVVFALFKLPLFSDIFVDNITAFAVMSFVVYGLAIISNLDIFKEIPTLFTKKATADSLCCVSVITIVLYSAIALSREVSPVDIMLLGMISLSFRAIGSFIKSSYILSNLRQINTNMKKRAIRLIDENAITFAMAKDAIDGDVLIAAPQYTANISDYMKYTTFGTFMNGKLSLITIVSLITSLVMGFVIGAYFSNLVYGFYTASSIFCFAGMPLLYLIENLPLYTASKKLNRRGAMIAGKTGAQAVEMANAVVLNSEDLFPFGTVTLHDIKVLSENSIDDTIIRAASLTDAIGSPLSNIFKKIAGTSSISALPVSDTIKYEDRMGISGWVDDKLLFIGNRTLLEAHGIAVPSVENDRKILKNGYFPVYVASGSSVCALLIIQYSVNPDVSHELRRLTASGVTILVNNTDPNLTEEMVCDYLGLYDDSVKIMSAAGTHMYKTTVRQKESASAPAAYKGNPLALATIINCAGRIKKSNILLTVIYSIAAIIGAVLFIYAPFSGSGSMLSGSFIMLYNLISTAVAYLLYLTLKP